MTSEVVTEIQTLSAVIEDWLEKGESPDGFQKSLPLRSHRLSAEDVDRIRSGLEKKLAHVSPDFFPEVLFIESLGDEEPGLLQVSFFRSYKAEHEDLRWFVDIPQGACWYFKVEDQQSAHELAQHLNQSHNRKKFDAHGPDSALDRSLIKLALLDLRSAGIRVSKFGFKSSNDFDHVEPDMFEVS